MLPTEIVHLLCFDIPVLVCCSTNSQLTPLHTKKKSVVNFCVQCLPITVATLLSLKVPRLRPLVLLM